MDQYNAWIQEYIKCTEGNVLGKCAAAVLEMVEAFPELKKIRGHVAIPDPDSATGFRMWPHWWCVSPTEERVDPTASQFPIILFYEEWNDAKPEPTGKCGNCGEYCFNGDNFCCSHCESAVRADLGF